MYLIFNILYSKCFSILISFIISCFDGEILSSSLFFRLHNGLYFSKSLNLICHTKIESESSFFQNLVQFKESCYADGNEWRFETLSNIQPTHRQPVRTSLLFLLRGSAKALQQRRPDGWVGGWGSKGTIFPNKNLNNQNPAYPFELPKTIRQPTMRIFVPVLSILSS